MHSGTAEDADFNAADDRNSTAMSVWLSLCYDAVPSGHSIRQECASPAPTLRALADRACGKLDDVI